MKAMFRGACAVFCLSLTMASAAPQASAQFISGGGTLTGKEKLAVQGCGRDRTLLVVDAIINANGTWGVLVSGLGYTGSYVPTGASGRKFDLTFDQDSFNQFIAVLEGDAGVLCGQSVAATSAEKKKFMLKLNGKRTRAVVILKYRFTGTSGGRSGRAKYMIKVKGDWVP